MDRLAMSVRLESRVKGYRGPTGLNWAETFDGITRKGRVQLLLTRHFTVRRILSNTARAPGLSNKYDERTSSDIGASLIVIVPGLEYYGQSKK